MKRKILLCLALAGLEFSGPARPVRGWSDGDLSAASDLVVVGRAIKVKDLDETNSLGWFSTAAFQSRFRGVETTFKISAVRKGTPVKDQIVLHHYREEIGWGVPDDGPTFIRFTPGETDEYLLYLKADGTNRYAPAAGQADPGISVKSGHFGDTAPLHAVMAKLSAKVPQLSVTHLLDRGPYGQNAVWAECVDTNGSKLRILAKAYDSEAAAKAGQEFDQAQIQAGGWNKKEIIEGAQVFEFTDYGTMFFRIGRDTFNLTVMGDKKGAAPSLLATVGSALIADLAPQAEETDRVENNREILRLAALINPTNPPVTDQMLETGEFRGSLRTPGSEFVCFQDASPENSQPILVRLLKYCWSAERRKGFGESADIVEDGVRERAAQVLIRMASPAVVPVLREWLKQGLAAVEAGKQCRWGEVAEAAKGLSQFRDVTVVPPLVKAWQDGVFETKMDARFLADMAAQQLSLTVLWTLAEMPSPLARTILLHAMNDKRLDESTRYTVAAALVRLDDQSARDLLLDGLGRYLATDRDTLESSRHRPAFYELEELGDAKLISTIEARAAAAVRRRPKLVMPPLVERMRLNNLPMAELKRIAAEEKPLDRRLPAISILGDTGNSDLLPFLESLTLGSDDNLGASQKSLFAGVVKGAIRNVQLHNWQEPEKKP